MLDIYCSEGMPPLRLPGSHVLSKFPAWKYPDTLRYLPSLSLAASLTSGGIGFSATKKRSD